MEQQSTLTPSNWTINALCLGEEHSECVCHDGLPRTISTYVKRVGDHPSQLFEFYILCNPCRARLEKMEIHIAPAGVLPINGGSPVSAI